MVKNSLSTSRPYPGLNSHERIWSSFLLFGLAIFLCVDLIDDWLAGSSSFHLIIEGALSFAAGAGAVWLNFKIFRMRRQLEATFHELEWSRSRADSFQADAEKWKAESAKFLTGLSQAIDAQLERWHLSAAEKEVALLLLKGLPLKEIADLRRVSEGTIRQQTISIYEKSKTGGRAELSAYFLEDLLVPNSDSELKHGLELK